MQKLLYEQVLQVSYLKDKDPNGFWADDLCKDLVLLVHSSSTVILLATEGNSQCTGLYRRRELQDSAHPEVLSSLQVWASPSLNVPPHLEKPGEQQGSQQKGPAQRLSACVVESEVPFEPESPRLLAGRDCTQQISSIHCSLSETWSENPTDHLSSQPCDLQPHRAAIHPPSFLHRRRWERCYQQLHMGNGCTEEYRVWFKVTLSLSQSWTP